MLEAAASGHYRPELEQLFPRVAEVPFDSAVKRMLTIHSVEAAGAEHPVMQALGVHTGDRLVFAKGASDAIMPICVADPALQAAVSRQVDDLAAQGQRVLAVAFRLVKAHETLDLVECQRGLVASWVWWP